MDSGTIDIKPTLAMPIKLSERIKFLRKTSFYSLMTTSQLMLTIHSLVKFSISQTVKMFMLDAKLTTKVKMSTQLSSKLLWKEMPQP